MANERRKLCLKVNGNGLSLTNENGIAIKLASPTIDHPYQGLAFSEFGQLIAVKGAQGPSGDTSTSNLPGNGIGDPSLHTTDPMSIIGANSTVSRHKNYYGTNTFIRENDGVCVSAVDSNGSIIAGCLAHYIINR